MPETGFTWRTTKGAAGLLLAAERAVHAARGGGALGTPFTLEAAPLLKAATNWQALFTTNPAAVPFEFTDTDVRYATQPRKFYRVRQP